MIIIADNRIPDEAKSQLEKYGGVEYLSSKGITYPAVSGHPDIFFCQLGVQLIATPNTPVDIIYKLTKESVGVIFGKSEIGNIYPETARYNAVITDEFFIHNTAYSDIEIKKNSTAENVIHVNQAYTRCNLIPLKNNCFITSDRGIENALLKSKLDVLYVNPDGILLPGHKNGFIGGACGITEYKLFFLGDLDYFPEGDKIRKYITDYEIIELYKGPLFDGGSLIFIS